MDVVINTVTSLIGGQIFQLTSFSQVWKSLRDNILDSLFICRANPPRNLGFLYFLFKKIILDLLLSKFYFLSKFSMMLIPVDRHFLSDEKIFISSRFVLTLRLHQCADKFSMAVYKDAIGMKVKWMYRLASHPMLTYFLFLAIVGIALTAVFLLMYQGIMTAMPQFMTWGILDDFSRRIR